MHPAGIGGRNARPVIDTERRLASRHLGRCLDHFTKDKTASNVRQGFQNVAIGLSTDPVAPGTAAGEAVTRNSQRLRLSASRPTSSRSRLSKMGMPMATMHK